jgi:PadR family transcriptional regulator, regulatory protein PadR
LYPALHRLEQQGLIAAEWGTSDNNQRAKFYTLTPAGRRHLQEARARWTTITEAIARVLGPA